MSVDNTDDEEKVVTKASIETDKPPPSSAEPVVVTRAQIDIEEPPFQPVTSNLSSSGSTPINASTYAITFSFGFPIVVTRSLIEI